MPKSAQPKNKQCRHCPWRADADPRDIPNGYCATKHANLCNTIAGNGQRAYGGTAPLRVMACHETPVGGERPCVGWLHNQLGVGNNIALRLAVFTGAINANYELVGEQHPDFDSTLPTDKD